MLFHPILIHFPIAFYFLELLLLLFWAVKKNEEYRRFALFVFRAGYWGMLAAMLAGVIDSGGWEHIMKHVKAHFFSAIGVFTVYTVRAFYWKLGDSNRSSYKKILLAGAFLGTLLVAVTGYFGGLLVYGS